MLRKEEGEGGGLREEKKMTVQTEIYYITFSGTILQNSIINLIDRKQLQLYWNTSGQSLNLQSNQSNELCNKLTDHV